MEISAYAAYSPSSVPSELSNTSSMLAWLTGLRLVEPLKMTSVIDSPRKFLAELSPITQRTASMMFDLPQPLGPTTAAMLLGKFTVVGSTKDLNPASLMHLSRTLKRPSGQKPPDRYCAGHMPSALRESAENHGRSLLRASVRTTPETRSSRPCAVPGRGNTRGSWPAADSRRFPASTGCWRTDTRRASHWSCRR